MRDLRGLVPGCFEGLEAVASQAVEMLVVSMNLKHPATAGLLMKIVNVLGHDAAQPSVLFQFGQRPMGGIRLLAEQDLAQRPVQLPGFSGIAIKNIEGGIFLGGKEGPEPAWTAEIWDAAPHRDSRPG